MTRQTLALLVLAGACGSRTETVVLHRSSCEVCHRPLNESGEPEGIADAHPWSPLSCTDCHGGNAWVCSTGVTLHTEEGPVCDGEWVYDQSKAHPSPGAGPSRLRNLTARQLDAADIDYLRFINPGDLRVARYTCGGSAPGAGGTGCHQTVVDRVDRSLSAHAGGELAAPRFRAGAQPDPAARVAAIPLTNPGAGGSLCDREALTRFEPPPLDPVAEVPPSVAEVQDDVLAKTCARCHLSDFGSNDAPGLYRSSGCSACHMPYGEDGLSKGDDPWVDRTAPSRPVVHTLQASPSDTQCVACHNTGGARIGLSWRGWRQRGAEGTDPPDAVSLGRPLFGMGGDEILVDESSANDWDETPPDVHFAAGMQCVDCHTAGEVHGDGPITSTVSCEAAIGCEACHGTPSGRATADPSLPRLQVDGDGVRLTLAGTGEILDVPQVVDAITPGHPRYRPLAEQAMGNPSHIDTIECYTCHSSWAPSCYGCHTTLDLAGEGRSLITGAISPGAVRRDIGAVALHDLVLIESARGKLAPGLPIRWLATLLAPGRDVPILSEHPRSFPSDENVAHPGFGQRAVNPHTIQRRTGFMACNRCHSEGSAEAPENGALLDLTFGHGTERFVQSGCGTNDPNCTWRLDATRDAAGRPLVVPGPPGARLLDPALEARMRAIVVPPEAEPRIPPAPAADGPWPPALPP